MMLHADRISAHAECRAGGVRAPHIHRGQRTDPSRLRLSCRAPAPCSGLACRISSLYISCYMRRHVLASRRGVRRSMSRTYGINITAAAAELLMLLHAAFSPHTCCIRSRCSHDGHCPTGGYDPLKFHGIITSHHIMKTWDC